MKISLIVMVSFLASCSSFKPVATMDNFQLYQEYLDKQYRLSEIEQEYEDLILSGIPVDPFHPLPVKGYKVTGEWSGAGSFGFTRYELAPVYDYDYSKVTASFDDGEKEVKRNAEKAIKRLKGRIAEIERELSKRGLVP